MNLPIKLPQDWDNMHHAYLISGVAPSELWAFIEEKLEFKKQGNPDASDIVLETFGIDEARDLATWAYKKSFGERKLSILSASSITVEAQNALLKIFEEPPINTYFFLLLTNSGAVLPTLLSRMHILGRKEENSDKSASIFIKSSLGKRKDIISKIVKDKDKNAAKELVRNLLSEYKSLKKYDHSERLMQAEMFLSTRSPSIKMILENLAVSL